MEKFSIAKNQPIRTFLGDETKNASGLNGPGAIAEDIDILIKMFSPYDVIKIVDESGETIEVRGGISEKNLHPDLRDRIKDVEKNKHQIDSGWVTFNENYEFVESDISFDDVSKYHSYNVDKSLWLIVDVEGVNCDMLFRYKNAVYNHIAPLFFSYIGYVGDFVYEVIFWNPEFKSDGTLVELKRVGWLEKILESIQKLESFTADGSITEEKLAPEVQEKLNKGDSVPDWALKPEKPTYTAAEVGTYSKEETQSLLSTKQNTYDDFLETYNKTIVGAINEVNERSEAAITAADRFFIALAEKANKATTLSGYGITDAYSMDDIDRIFEEHEAIVSKKMEETVLYKAVVNTPEWTNQPAYEGNLDSSFNVNDFYYVTLKDADGNALPSGQFMLKDSYTDDSTVYSTVFLLPDLATGEDTLVENFPVEFTETGTTVTLRDAGVSAISQDIASWNICNGTGSIRSVLQGEVIPRNTNLYCYSHFKTDKNVASYHSSNGTTAFSGNSTKDIVPYTTIPELANVGNILFDDAVLKKDGNGCFSVERKFVVRYNENYKNAKSYQVFGFGKALSDDINITSVAFRMNSDKNGMFRNGTKIIVSEVK
ncbi:MAG: hypothetical protein J6K51_01815 [Clostridia bacterium]|nr:hypothetical protein [Clostridia bacterium]